MQWISVSSVTSSALILPDLQSVNPVMQLMLSWCLLCSQHLSEGVRNECERNENEEQMCEKWRCEYVLERRC